MLVHLNLALGSLTLPVLEKKLTGATMIIMKVLKPADSQVLAEWCDQVHIFALFFTRSLHAELIKKSFYLLEYLHKNGRLQEPELAQMWHVATKKHEAFRHAALKALSFLVEKCLDWHQVSYLVDRIKQMPLREHDRVTLQLLPSIAKRLSPKPQQAQPVAATMDLFQTVKRTRS